MTKHKPAVSPFAHHQSWSRRPTRVLKAGGVWMCFYAPVSARTRSGVVEALEFITQQFHARGDAA